MTRIEVSQKLDASPAQLYSTIANTATWREWFTMHDKFLEDPPEQIAVNSRLVQNIRMLGMTHKLELTITDFKPPMRLTMSGTAAAGVTCEFSFSIERRPGGADLTITGDFGGPLLTAQLAQAVGSDAQAQLTESLNRLAALSEAAAELP
jgi:hypothetical protein